jgi:hypothetical protein
MARTAVPFSSLKCFDSSNFDRCSDFPFLCFFEVTVQPPVLFQVLSGIAGPARQPHSIVPNNPAVVGTGGEMTMVTSEAAIGLPFTGEIIIGDRTVARQPGLKPPGSDSVPEFKSRTQ